MMKGQGQHPMLPDNTHDESSRQMFVQTMKLHLARQVSPHLKTVYRSRVEPELKKTLGRAPKDRHDVRRGMTRDPAYQMWSSLQRSSQEMKQDAQTQIAFRQLDELAGRAERLGRNGKGSLRVNPKLAMPRYVTAVDIHIIPGGSHNELKPGDVLPGAVYDPGVFLYSMGRMGAFNEDMGATLLSHIKETRPGWRPKKILDLGCAVGHSTLPYVDAFPDAHVHALDVSAPMVRYGHARAQALGKVVHFSQQNAEHTDFADNTFDLVVSHILLHETAHTALCNIFKECHRVLKPGGLMVHCETPLYSGMDAYDQFILDWDTYNNNEPFWGPLKDLDLKRITKESGFQPKSFFAKVQPSAVGADYARGRTKLFQGGDFGGAGAWFLVGAEK